MELACYSGETRSRPFFFDVPAIWRTQKDSCHKSGVIFDVTDLLLAVNNEGLKMRAFSLIVLLVSSSLRSFVWLFALIDLCLSMNVEGQCNGAYSELVPNKTK